MTASRKGVTFNELEDLISLDDMVMEELCVQYKVIILRKLKAQHFLGVIPASIHSFKHITQIIILMSSQIITLTIITSL